MKDKTTMKNTAGTPYTPEAFLILAGLGCEGNSNVKVFRYNKTCQERSSSINISQRPEWQASESFSKRHQEAWSRCVLDAL